MLIRSFVARLIVGTFALSKGQFQMRVRGCICGADLMTEQERERLRLELRERLQERAKEKGVSAQDDPERVRGRERVDAIARPRVVGEAGRRPGSREAVALRVEKGMPLDRLRIVCQRNYAEGNMKRMSRLAGVATLAIIFVAPTATAEKSERYRTHPRTETQSPLQPPVYGSPLMTQQERDEYYNRLHNAPTQQERERVRAEHRQRMQQRAQERGLSLPAQPQGPAVGGTGSDMGGGMGDARR
jgi:hypothetical protein